MPITLTVKGAIAEILFDHPPVNAFDTKGWESIPAMVYEAAANVLTNAALDPFGKIAEVKYCAVKVKKGGKVEPLSSYGGGQSYREKSPA